ncbi:hypothetical protein EJ110_NYTH22232 [Nymphaea thermarum]|nr:hypothetical protein EJ110_NYTH22232 [Nymphaea thermarum]
MPTNEMNSFTNSDNPIGINVKCDLNLRHAPGCWRNSYKLKFTQELVVCSHFTLSLQYPHTYLSLVVCSGGEDLIIKVRSDASETNSHTEAELLSHREYVFMPGIAAPTPESEHP